jgi:hypothetical protein
MMISGLNLASVCLMNYSTEQLRRKAHLENGGTLANYDRSHYRKKENKMKTLTNKFFEVATSDTPQALALLLGIVIVEISILVYFTAR